jgi:hypothetical protein
MSHISVEFSVQIVYNKLGYYSQGWSAFKFGSEQVKDGNSTCKTALTNL